MAERDPPDEIPAAWLELAAAEGGGEVPASLSEDPPAGRDDSAEVESVIRQVRESVR
jgi:hypothetical protein